MYFNTDPREKHLRSLLLLWLLLYVSVYLAPCVFWLTFDYIILHKTAVSYVISRTKPCSLSPFHEPPFIFLSLVRLKLSLAGSELYNPHPAIHTVIANAQLSWYTQLSHWRVTDSLKAALRFSEQRKAHWLWLIGHFPSVQALGEQRENTHTQGGVTLAETLPAAATSVCVCLSAEAASALNTALKSGSYETISLKWARFIL